MKRLVSALFFMVVFSGFVFSVPSEVQATTLQTTVSGIVQAAEANEEGEIVTVKLFTGDEYIMIERSEMAVELMALIDETVEIQGTVSEDGDGNKSISVADYRQKDSEHEMTQKKQEEPKDE